MPEGDSLHRVAVRLQPLVGHCVAASSPHPRGLVTGVATAIDGRRLERVDAVGKHLLLRFEGGVTLRSHLGMTGRWRVGKAGSAGSGRPWLVLRAGGLEATQWNGPELALGMRRTSALGPDLLADDIEPGLLVARLRRTDQGRRLGEALRDQLLVSGIGNMWMSETLWAARLSPWLTVGDASDDELLAVLSWARTAMRSAVHGRRPGRSVYRRAGRACPRCGAMIRSRGQGLDNRTAYWCAACQPGPDDGSADHATGDPGRSA